MNQTRLGAAYSQLIAGFTKLVREGVEAGLDETAADFYARRILVLLRGPAQGILSDTVRRDLEALVPDVTWVTASGETSRRPVRRYLDACKQGGRTLYFYRAEHERRNVQSRTDADDSSIQITETIQMNLRVSLLRAKGDVVVACKLRRFQETTSRGNAMLDVHEADVLAQAAAAAGVGMRGVDKATLDELELHWSPQSQLLGRVLDIGGDLKVAYLESSRDRVVRDFTGRILNSAHEEVQRVLRTLPEAAGNPIRRALIHIYMDLANHQYGDARQRVLELLTQEDLEEQAGLRGGPLQREYLRKKVSDMLPSPSDTV